MSAISKSIARRLLVQAPELRTEVLREIEEWLREQYEMTRAKGEAENDSGLMGEAVGYFEVGRRFFGWEDGDK